MNDMVNWRDDPHVPEQQFGRVGRLDLFVVGHDEEQGFMLACRGLFGPDEIDGFGLVKYFPTPQEAQQAAEERIATLLRDLDVIPRAAS